MLTSYTIIAQLSRPWNNIINQSIELIWTLPIFSTNVLLFCSRIPHYIWLSHLLSLLQVVTFPRSSLCFSWPWHLKRVANYFVECSPIWVSSDAFSRLVWHIWARIPQKWHVPFSVHHIGGTWCLITSDVKVMHARFLQCKATIFPLAINKYLLGRDFETMWISSCRAFFFKGCFMWKSGIENK